ncbi:MAG TPA: N-acetyl-gamma-glutamyl-phosphate reductase [Terriglobia bacterium]|nr:N-acetyl-gamma-glutamyl-phosphate reductase [Terriglobia bacterium]
MNIYAHRVAIVGVTGYAGRELDRLLSSHPKIRVTGRFASKVDEKSGAEAFSLERLQSSSPDAVVLATEHELSMHLVPELLSQGYRVVDMSGAFRLKEPRLYQEWYGFEHTAPHLLNEAVYGLPEFLSESIQGARLVANPGCYATAAVLPLMPLYKTQAIDPMCTVVVDGKSGVSGAGRQPKPETHFCEVNENISAYGVLKHRHTPEMLSQLPGASFDRFVFTAHLIPITRGILNTVTLRTSDRVSAHLILSETYARTPFVKVWPVGQLPDVQSVSKTNLCSIGVVAKGPNTVIVSVIDNLVKGAAGQAIQNLNLMFGCEPTAGLA